MPPQLGRNKDFHAQSGPCAFCYNNIHKSLGSFVILNGFENRYDETKTD